MAFAVSALAETNDWATPITPKTVTLASLRLDHVMVDFTKSNNVRVAVNVTYLDAGGLDVKRSSVSYDEVQLDAILRANGSNATVMKALFRGMAEGNRLGYVSLSFVHNAVIAVVRGAPIVDGVAGKAGNRMLKEYEIEAMLQAKGSSVAGMRALFLAMAADQAK